MSNHLSKYTRTHPDVACGFDHEDGRRAIRLQTNGADTFWIAWHDPRTLVTNPDGSPTLFPSASRAARYLEDHHNG